MTLGQMMCMHFGNIFFFNHVIRLLSQSVLYLFIDGILCELERRGWMFVSIEYVSRMENAMPRGLASFLV